MSKALVKLISVKVDDPNHVGKDGEWFYLAKVNDVNLKNEEEKSIETVNDTLKFYLEAYEKDKVIDKGTLSETYIYQDIQNKSIKLNDMVSLLSISKNKEKEQDLGLTGTDHYDIRA